MYVPPKKFTIVAYDDAKNVTLQKVIVDVVDLVKPVIVQKNTIRTRYNNSLEDDLSLDEKKVLDFISKNENADFSQQDIINHLGKSISTVNRILSSLTKKGKIFRMGSNKSGSWRVS